MGSPNRLLMPSLAAPEFTGLQHRISERMIGVVGEYDSISEQVLRLSLDRAELFDGVESMVGSTPLIHVEDVETSSIIAKVESGNPTENHYDRVFPRTIKRLEEDGIISPGDELIEVTSGSGGRAFAWAARVLGYQARVIVPPELPRARIQDIKGFGATIEVTDPGYMKEVSRVYVRRINELKRQGFEVTKHETEDYTVFTASKEGRRVCFVNHSANELTVKGFDGIGEEVAYQMPAGENVDFIVTVMGNGTSTTALSRTMRKHYPGVRVVGVEDERSPFYYNQKYPGKYEHTYGKAADYPTHDMYGSSTPGVRLKYGKAEVVDDIRLVNPDERDTARNCHNARYAADFERIGNTSAASLVVARQLAHENPGSRIVIVFYDKADQYGDSLTLGNAARFRGARPLPEGVPTSGWSQTQVGKIALMPRTLRQAYTA